MTPDFSQNRLLIWPDCMNSRELGGYPLKNGAQTRWKTIVRSDNPVLLTPFGQQALVAYGIRTVIDLRFPYELKINPSTFANHGPDAIDYINIPLDQDQDLAHGLLPGKPAEAMSDLYIRLLETNRSHVARVLSAMGWAHAGGVLFHCHAGKDRTGLISALLLGVAGAAPEVIAADYAFTYPRLEQRRQESLNNPDWDEVARRYHVVLSTALPETMLILLEALKKRYGGVKGYLETTPLKNCDLDALLARFTAESPIAS
jgi:protein-tyrosine phosphatase